MNDKIYGISLDISVKRNSRYKEDNDTSELRIYKKERRNVDLS